MTTIAATSSGIAGDSLVTDGSTKYYARKVYRAGPSVIGYAGDVKDGLKWVNWMKSGAPLNAKPELGEDFEGLVVGPRGIYYVDGHLAPFWVEEDTAAIGSGAQVALGALRSGAGLRAAVRQAASVDLSTGGRITVLEIRS